MFKKHEESIVKILTANNNMANQRIEKLTGKSSDLSRRKPFSEAWSKIVSLKLIS